jgi:hypothetical protein
LVHGFAAAVKIRGAIAGNGSEPAREFGDFAKRGEAREGLEENVLDEVVDIGVGDAGKKDAVDHAGVAGVEEAEGRAVALLGGADQGVVGDGMLAGCVHCGETGAGGVEFKECRHVVSIETKCFS